MSDASIEAGLQVERTLLGWRRTQLSLVLVGCLSLRWLGTAPSHAVLILALAFGAALWIGRAQRNHYQRHLARIVAGHLPANLFGVFALAFTAVMLVLVALAACLSMLLR